MILIWGYELISLLHSFLIARVKSVIKLSELENLLSAAAAAVQSHKTAM